jgi:hypothetical protein
MAMGQRAESGPVEGVAGFEVTPAETLAIWEADAERWPSAGSPWRPSAGDVAVYRRLAGPKLSGRVLVLGVTPELRDAVADAGGRPVVFDVSAGMYAAATRLLRRADPARETWIQGDWCEPSVPDGEFDLVLGDMIWWGLSVGRQHTLRDRIHAALQPAGLFVGRFRFTDVTRADQSAVAMIDAYLKQLDGAPDEERTLRGAMVTWLYDHTADGELNRLDREKAGALVLSLAARPEFSEHRQFLQGLAERLPGPNWTSQTREELLAVVYTRFHVVGEGRAEDYDSGDYPVIALQPA